MWAKVFASLGVLICIGLAVHMCLSPRAKSALSRWGLKVVQRLRAQRRRQTSSASDKLREQAAREEARAVIARAKSGARPEGEWDGNVYRPKRFGKQPRKPH